MTKEENLVGEKIREARLKLKKTYREVAQEVGVTPAGVQLWERTGNPKKTHWKAIQESLGVNVEALKEQEQSQVFRDIMQGMPVAQEHTISYKTDSSRTSEIADTLRASIEVAMQHLGRLTLSASESYASSEELARDLVATDQVDGLAQQLRNSSRLIINTIKRDRCLSVAAMWLSDLDIQFEEHVSNNSGSSTLYLVAKTLGCPLEVLARVDLAKADDTEDPEGDHIPVDIEFITNQTTNTLAPRGYYFPSRSMGAGAREESFRFVLRLGVFVDHDGKSKVIPQFVPTGNARFNSRYALRNIPYYIKEEDLYPKMLRGAIPKPYASTLLQRARHPESIILRQALKEDAAIFKP